MTTIVEKLAALSIARKAIRQNESRDIIKAKLLKSTYFQQDDLKSCPDRAKILIDKILIQAQLKENSKI